MQNKNEKNNLFDFIRGNTKAKKSSCCGGFEIEEIPEGEVNPKEEKAPIVEHQKEKKSSCCGNFEVEEIPDESNINKE